MLEWIHRMKIVSILVMMQPIPFKERPHQINHFLLLSNYMNICGNIYSMQFLWLQWYEMYKKTMVKLIYVFYSHNTWYTKHWVPPIYSSCTWSPGVKNIVCNKYCTINGMLSREMDMYVLLGFLFFSDLLFLFHYTSYLSNYLLLWFPSQLEYITCIYLYLTCWLIIWLMLSRMFSIWVCCPFESPLLWKN